MHRTKQRSSKSKNYRALVRAVGVVAAVVVIVSGVTFAALQSQQNVLTGNAIETATANLQLSTNGVNYASSQIGFDFSNLVPGGAAMPVAGYGFYLKNVGSTPLSLKLSVASVPSNPANVDLAKVNVLLTAVGSGSPVQTTTVQSLLSDGGVALTSGNLLSGVNQQYKLQISMASDAFSGPSASLGNIDFAFNGTAVQ